MDEDQPILPVRPDPPTADYFPEGDDGVPWSVQDWPALKEAFGLEESELVGWHREVSGQGRYWLIVRRIFGVMAVFGDAVEEEDSEDWNWGKLSKVLSLPESQLKTELSELAAHWKKIRVAQRIGNAKAASGGGGESASSSAFGPHSHLSDEKIKELLVAYRFEHLSGNDRMFVANRLLEMRGIMEDRTRRESGRQLINMELNLADSESTRAALKKRLDVIHKQASDISKDSSKEVREISEALEKNQRSHTELMKSYLKAAEEIGGEEMEQGEQKRVALGTASYFVEAIREFYESGERTLIDGVFTADELVWYTTPIPLRPAQYRPDIVLRIREAMEPQNLWNGDYVPTPIQREASRRMLKLSRQLMEEEEEERRIPEIDDAAEADEGEETDAAADFLQDDSAASTTPYEATPMAEAPAADDFFVIS
ncbi:MAG: hypothetical protein EOP85_00155 [Verrucomicrobiaceae bacterium]|nr:MAG: hypothetical protein EOP85_00155 [Verrucomicrobiaceae bacterium]